MENTEVNSNRGSAPLCFLIGMGAGIAAMLLLAPRSGAATRRMIGRKVEAGKGWMKGQAGSASDYVRGHGDDLRDRVTEAAEAIAR